MPQQTLYDGHLFDTGIQLLNVVETELVDVQATILGPPEYDRYGNYKITLQDEGGHIADLHVWSALYDEELRVGSTYRFQNVKRRSPEANGVKYEIGAKTEFSQLEQSHPSDLSLLHVSDTHLGRETTSKDDATKFDYDTRFREVVRLALRHHVDGILHTGDFFDDGVSANTIETVRTQLGRLTENGIPVYYVRGNHGCDDGDELLNEETRRGRLVPLSNVPELLGNGSLALYGLDYDDVPGRLGETAPNQPAPMNAYRLLAWHGPVEPIAHTGIPLQQLTDASSVELDAVALGDLHNPKRVCVNEAHTLTGDPIRAFYAGATTEIARVPNSYVPSVWLLRLVNGTLERHPISLVS